MTVQLSVKLSTEELKVANDAANWAILFYPDIEFEFQDHLLNLRSGCRTETSLRAVWRSALLNERLRADQQAFRADVLERLSQ